MQFQTLSVVVPTGRCVNECPFCVSRMHDSPYQFMGNNEDVNVQDSYFNQYKRRLQFAQDNGSNTMVFTGTAEPLQNKKFIKRVADINASIRKPFMWMEIQTTGVYLLHQHSATGRLNLDFLKDEIGISTIALSIVDPFNDTSNMDTMNVQPKLRFSLEELTKAIKSRGLNLRLCFNLTQVLKPEHRSLESLIRRAKDLGANQLTLRQMYHSGDVETNQDQWVRINTLHETEQEELYKGIQWSGKELDPLPTGAKKYSIEGMSVVYDNDCMSSAPTKEAIRYLILQSDAKLYTKWDDPASLVF